MKVLELKTKQIIEVNESFGARLIEHGMAILTPTDVTFNAQHQPSAVPAKDSDSAPKMMKKSKEPRKKGDA